jgi:DNA-binding transcriptional LysR family regulator
MNLASVDLNLLVALDALVAEAHVGRAARKIGRSQPAVSHALMRLRDLLGDPLLIRIGSRMELTPRAFSLKESLPETLERVRSLLRTESFQPVTSSRRFIVVMQDHLADLVVPDLVRRLQAEAPGVRLQVLPWQSPFSMKPEHLRQVDLCVSCSTDDLPGFERNPLFTDSESVVVRERHPRGSRMRTLQTFLDSSHVAVVGRGRTEDPVDTWLREERIDRRIVLVVPSYLQALHVAAATDLVAFVPTRLAQTLAEHLPLTVVRPPIDPGTYQEFLFYPVRRQRDPASLWLREIVVEIGRRLDGRALRPGVHRNRARRKSEHRSKTSECKRLRGMRQPGLAHRLDTQFT